MAKKDEKNNKVEIDEKQLKKLWERYQKELEINNDPTEVLQRVLKSFIDRYHQPLETILLDKALELKSNNLTPDEVIENYKSTLAPFNDKLRGVVENFLKNTSKSFVEEIDIKDWLIGKAIDKQISKLGKGAQKYNTYLDVIDFLFKPLVSSLYDTLLETNALKTPIDGLQFSTLSSFDSFHEQIKNARKNELVGLSDEEIEKKKIEYYRFDELMNVERNRHLEKQPIFDEINDFLTINPISLSLHDPSSEIELRKKIEIIDKYFDKIVEYINLDPKGGGSVTDGVNKYNRLEDIGSLKHFLLNEVTVTPEIKPSSTDTTEKDLLYASQNKDSEKLKGLNNQLEKEQTEKKKKEQQSKSKHEQIKISNDDFIDSLMDLEKMKQDFDKGLLELQKEQNEKKLEEEKSSNEAILNERMDFSARSLKVEQDQSSNLTAASEMVSTFATKTGEKKGQPKDETVNDKTGENKTEGEGSDKKERDLSTKLKEAAEKLEKLFSKDKDGKTKSTLEKIQGLLEISTDFTKTAWTKILTGTKDVLDVFKSNDGDKTKSKSDKTIDKIEELLRISSTFTKTAWTKILTGAKDVLDVFKSNDGDKSKSKTDKTIDKIEELLRISSTFTKSAWTKILTGAKDVLDVFKSNDGDKERSKTNKTLDKIEELLRISSTFTKTAWTKILTSAKDVIGLFKTEKDANGKETGKSTGDKIKGLLDIGKGFTKGAWDKVLDGGSKVVDIFTKKEDKKAGESTGEENKGGSEGKPAVENTIKATSDNVLENSLGEVSKFLTNYAEEAGKGLGKIVKTNKDAQEQIAEDTKEGLDQQKEHLEGFAGTMQEYVDKVKESVEVLTGVLTEIFTQQKEESEKRLEEITQKYDEVVQKREESSARLTELEEQEKDARGGRALVFQEQINAEMQKNMELAQQEKELKKQKEKEEKEKEKKEKQLKKVELSQQLIMAVANTALGVTKALASSIPPLNFILAALVGAQGAIQIATISKQMSKLEEGGLLEGKLHRDGGMRIEGSNIEVEGGEYVINRRSTAKNLGLLRYINNSDKQITSEDMAAFFGRPASAREVPFRRVMEQGGQIPSVNTSVEVDNTALIEAIRSIHIEPKVAVTDIIRAQDQMTAVDNWTGM